MNLHTTSINLIKVKLARILDHIPCPWINHNSPGVAAGSSINQHFTILGGRIIHFYPIVTLICPVQLFTHPIPSHTICRENKYLLVTTIMVNFKAQ